MKYVMFICQMPSGIQRLEPVIFGNNLVHADVAETVLKTVLKEEDGWSIRSAGEYSPLDGDCYGESTTLRVSSHPDDSHAIQMLDYGGGII